ncbi:ABC transporter permease [Numidum massiliense]|uniref:ABC transporter permease n=1 Tax=Numidum massiliense TaxID=1522315 RepID=UPI0006D571F0|nr:ABC transporter permease [Numidum massiliense]
MAKRKTSGKRHPAYAALLLLVPSLIVMIGVFVLPLFFMFLQSFQNYDETFTLQNYLLFVQDPFYLEILWRTIRVSLWTVLTCLVLAFPVALFMSKVSGRLRGVVTFLIISPHLVSVVIRNFGWMTLLGEKGWINETLLKLGVIDAPLRLLYNELGIVIGLTDSFIVYMVLALATSLYTIDPSLYKAASILGGSRLRAFFDITLPLSLPGIVAGTTLVFSLSMSAFVTPALMGGTSVKVLPVIAYETIMTTLNWPLGAAISFMLLFFTVLLVNVFTRLVERKRYREVFSS